MKKLTCLVSLCLILCAAQGSARAQQKDGEKAQPQSGAQTAPVSPPQTSDYAYARAEVDQKAVILWKPPPSYTEEARKKEVAGTVRLRVVLGADGGVRDIKALTELPYGLTENALSAARFIRFRPAVKDGRPVSQYVTFEYNFGIIGVTVVGDEVNKVYYRSGCADYSRITSSATILLRNSKEAKKAGYKEAKTKCP